MASMNCWLRVRSVLMRWARCWARVRFRRGMVRPWSGEGCGAVVAVGVGAGVVVFHRGKKMRLPGATE